MAYVIQEYCNNCESIQYITNGICNSCAERNKRKEIAIWNALTVDERLSDLRKRVEKLERGPIRF